MASTSWLAPFGARPTGERRARVERSPNFRDGAFQGPVPTVKMPPGSFWRSLRLQLTGKEQRVPPGPLPIAPLSRHALVVPPASGLRATWMGHSSALLEVDGVRVLLDPVWGERASPSALAGPRRFHPPPIALSALPPLDVVLLSHDHYDHLDVDAVRALAGDPAQPNLRFVAPLGVGAHLEHWGVAAHRITELDWGESTTMGALTITATPARHFSGRAIRDGIGRGNPTLWASFVIAGPAHRVFFSGDTGWFDGLADIGAAHGPFHLSLIKTGAYGETWPDVHLTPEEAVRAHVALRGGVLLPVHWGTFNLAFHAWDEPAERVLAAARAAGVTVALPRIGQPFEPSAPPPVEPWWRAVSAAR